jgi:hypothetical protein
MDSLHRHVWDLIPWVVAGTASEEDRRRVHAHAEGCAECRAEIDFHTAVREGLRWPAAADDGSADAAWARMQLRLDSEAEWPRAAADAAPPAAVPMPPPHPAASNATRWLAAAVVVQSVGLAALAGALVLRPAAAPQFETLSDATSDAAPTAPGAWATEGGVQLVLAPSATVGALGRAVSALGWQLADVSPDGQRLVAVPSQPGAQPREAALAALRMAPGVVLAEPMPSVGLPR